MSVAAMAAFLPLRVSSATPRQGSSSKPAGPWDSHAIRVTFDAVWVDDNKHLLSDLRRTYNFKSEIREKENPTRKQEQEEQKTLQILIDRIFPSFNGFVIFDKANSREIDLPKGW